MAARAGPTFELVLRDTPPEKLDQPYQDKHLCLIALEITNWVFLAPFLRVKAPEVEAIREKWPFNVPAQNLELLRRWKHKHQRKGKDTYRNLCKAFMSAKEVILAEKVCDILCSQVDTSESSSDEDEEDVTHPSPEPTHLPLTSNGTNRNSTILTAASSYPLEDLAEYLHMTYGCQTPDFAVLQWPPPPTFKVFNLAMIHTKEIVQRTPLDEAFVRLTLRGGVDDIMKMKSSIKLGDLFKRCHGSKECIVILIEGAPGSGKSTLSWDICQKWKAQVLFHQDFTIVIFVRLGDPEVQLAKEIADLIPMELESERKDAASSLKACHGKGVLFVLDGWDEYSPGLQPGSLFDKLICHPEKFNIPLSSVLITSRPVASGKLQPHATSRVEIVGFTLEEVGWYFEDIFKDPVMVQKLYDHLHKRPTIKASCYLPLNATIVAHLFMELNYTLPSTLHGLFYSLVLSCIIRHLTKESGTQPTIRSLEELPPGVQNVFENICILAYEGTMSNKVIFSSQDLHSYGLPEDLSTLSLMQVVQSFATGKPSSYHFLHLSVQELLTALYISKLPPSEQVHIFNELFNQPRFDAVFRFYAGFTKLQIEGMRDLLSRLVQVFSASKHSEPLYLYREQYSPKRKFLNLLHCVYEAQDASLCYLVSSQLHGSVDLKHETLSPLDHLSLKYFLSCVNVTSTGPAAGSDSVFRVVELNLEGCKLSSEDIDSLGLQNLVKLHSNRVSCACAANLLTNNPQLKELYLADCSLSDGVEHFAAVLKEHHSLEYIDISDEQHLVHGLSIILQAIHNHPSLRSLRVSCYCTEEMEAIAAVLEVNKTLRDLMVEFPRYHFQLLSREKDEDTISSCLEVIMLPSDRNFEEAVGGYLAIHASSLKINRTLEELTMFFLEFNIPRSMGEFVWSLRDCHLKRLKCFTGDCVVSDDIWVRELGEEMNANRREQGLPRLEVVYDI